MDKDSKAVAIEGDLQDRLASFSRPTANINSDSDHIIVRISQIVNLPIFLACFFGVLALDITVWHFNEYLSPYYKYYHVIILHVSVLSVVIYLYYKVKCEYFKITLQNIVVYKGVFNRDINNVELYRVKDYAINEPLHYRIFGLSTLMIISSDRLHPFLKMEGIRNATKVLNSLRVLVEGERIRLGVREID